MKIEKRNPKIFIISGKARHGKDTTAMYMNEIYTKKGKKILNISYASYIKEYAKKISNWDGSDETKPRELLQQLGTTVIRQNIDELFFVKRVLEDIDVYSYFFDVITISDARLKPEVIMPRQKFKNVFAIRVVRPNFDNGLTLEQQKHITEVDLDDYKEYDYYLVNDGSLEDLKSKVQNIVEDVENEY